MFELNLVKDRTLARKRKRMTALVVTLLFIVSGAATAGLLYLWYQELDKANDLQRQISNTKTQTQGIETRLNNWETVRKRRAAEIKDYRDAMELLDKREGAGFAWMIGDMTSVSIPEFFNPDREQESLENDYYWLGEFTIARDTQSVVSGAADQSDIYQPFKANGKYTAVVYGTRDEAQQEPSKHFTDKWEQKLARVLGKATVTEQSSQAVPALKQDPNQQQTFGNNNDVRNWVIEFNFTSTGRTLRGLGALGGSGIDIPLPNMPQRGGR